MRNARSLGGEAAPEAPSGARAPTPKALVAALPRGVGRGAKPPSES
jgi:hypothetical protein